MKKFDLKKITVVALILAGFVAQAQEKKGSNNDTDNKGRPIRYNHIKLSGDVALLPGVLGLSYERKLGKKFSATIGLFKPVLSLSSGSNNLAMNGFGFQPEIRWYAGKNAMRGWYFGLYYLHAGYSLDFTTPQTITFDDGNGNSVSTPMSLTVSLPLKHDGVGLSMGQQFLIGNRISFGIQFACSVGSKILANPIVTDITGTGNNPTGQAFTSRPIDQISDGDFSYSGAVSATTTDVSLTGQASYAFPTNLPGIYPKIGFSLGYVFGK